MLHFAMTVRRQSPTKEKRAPGQGIPKEAEAENKKAILSLFQNDTTPVESIVQGEVKAKLENDLQLLFKHRAKYYPPPTPRLIETLQIEGITFPPLRTCLKQYPAYCFNLGGQRERLLDTSGVSRPG
ncbi:MAG: hypothetical protein WDM81_07030 [Rhizomicrobium sp.]